MIKNVLKTKVGSSVAVAVAISMAATVGVASAHHSSWRLADWHDHGYVPGYTKDQCKNGGWKTNFPPGTFKNQGDCVSFFNHHDGEGNDDNQGNDNHHGDE